MSDRQMLSARVPAELKELVDADRRTNQEIVVAALWREFGGERMGTVERRIEEKERRISMIKTERNERQRELKEAKSELEALKSKRENIQGEKKDKRERILSALEMVPADPNNVLIKEKADELDITPEKLAKESAEYHGKELQTNDDNDLSSL